MSMFCVYRITCLENGTKYFGKTKNPERRWKSHKNDALKHAKYPLHFSMQKHGIEKFIFKIIHSCETELQSFELEKSEIAAAKKRGEKLYNLTEGGEGMSGFHHVAETREKISQGMSKYLKEHPENALNLHETREKSRKTWSKVLKKRCEEGIFSPPDWTGRKHRKESKKAIGLANSIQQKGEKNSQFGTVWISHFEQKISKRIKINELDTYLNEGWVKGRKIKW